MSDIKTRLTDWYRLNVVARWYTSLSLWVGIFASLFPYMLDVLDALLARWPEVAEVLQLSPMQTMGVQIFMAVVVLPAARAWRQKGMQQAGLVQAVQAGLVTSAPNTDAVTVQVPGTPAVTVSTMSSPADLLAGLQPGATALTDAEAIAEADRQQKANDAWTHQI